MFNKQSKSTQLALFIVVLLVILAGATWYFRK